MYIMKNAVVCILLAGIFSCASPTQNPELSSLLAQRDSLKSVYDEVAQQIAALETQIASLDTSSQKNIKQVITQVINKQPFAHYFQVQGVVESDQNSLITAEVPGTVQKVHVKIGDRVSEGQTLISIDPELILKGMDELKNGIDLANTLYEKQKALWDQKIGSEVQYLQAKNQKESLELKMASLKTQLSKTVIKAPFSGVVDEVMTKAGQMASAPMPVIRMINADRLYIKAEVSEQHIASVQKGDEVIIDAPSAQFKANARVSRLGNYIDPNNRTFRMEVDFDNTGGALKTNMVTYLLIQDYAQDSALVVPSSTIQQDAAGQDFVYVAKAKNDQYVTEKVLVKTGQNYQGKTEILSGLEPGMALITEGARSLAATEVIRVASLPVAVK